MKDRLLNQCEAAAMLGIGRKKVAEFLIGNGLYPIDLERGRGRGLRWPESEVKALIKRMFLEAQPKPRPERAAKPPAGLGKHLADMKVGEVYNLLNEKTKLTPEAVVQ